MIKEQVLEMLEEICEDEVVREDLDGLSIAPTEVTYEEIDTPNKVISYIENRK